MRRLSRHAGPAAQAGTDVTRRVTARTVFGIPALPPPAVTAAATRVRALVGRLHSGMTAPPARILESLFTVIEYQALVTLCDLGVPDALDRRMPVDTLAARLDGDPAELTRLLRYADNRGWLRLDPRRGRVRPTRVTRFLRRDHPAGWRAWVDFLGGDEITAALRNLTAALAGTTDDAFAAAHGEAFFPYLAARPERSRAFDESMAAGSRAHGLVLAATLDWSGTRTVCDVGGGTGELLRTLVERHPTVTGTVFDLPAVVAHVRPHERLAAVGGDMFEAVPPGHDAYLLVNVLHDWSDADTTRILTRVAEAMDGTTASRVVVLESDAATARYNTFTVATDLLMAALTPGGRERTAADFAALAQAAGLRLVRTTPLGPGEAAHELRPSAQPAP